MRLVDLLLLPRPLPLFTSLDSNYSIRTCRFDKLLRYIVMNFVDKAHYSV